MAVCVNCRSRLVVIDLRVNDEPIRMRSCSSCGERTWTREGDRLVVADVLDAAKAQAAHVRNPRRDPPGVA